VENAEQLATSVHSTSAISERVSYKVRELNTAQSRIESTLKRINIVVERSSAVEGMRSALAASDYESAAEHVSKYLDLEKRFGKMIDEVDSRQVQEQQKASLRHVLDMPGKLSEWFGCSTCLYAVPFGRPHTRICEAWLLA
jgi:hypothetical protein